MAVSPRIVTDDTVFTWDGVSQRLPKGQVLDVPPGSALEAAIGADRLMPLGAIAARPPAGEAPQGEPQPSGRRAPAKAKAQGPGGDGGS